MNLVFLAALLSDISVKMTVFKPLTQRGQDTL